MEQRQAIYGLCSSEWQACNVLSVCLTFIYVLTCLFIWLIALREFLGIVSVGRSLRYLSKQRRARRGRQDVYLGWRSDAYIRIIHKTVECKVYNIDYYE